MHNIDLAALGSSTLFFAILLIPIGIAVGTIILRAACSLYNKCVGGPLTPRSVPMPSVGWSIVITIIRALVNNPVRLGIVVGLVELAGPGSADRTLIILVGELISLPIILAISVGIIAASLPTTFLRGLGVTLLEFIITIVVLAVVGVVAGLISLAPFNFA